MEKVGTVDFELDDQKLGNRHCIFLVWNKIYRQFSIIKILVLVQFVRNLTRISILLNRFSKERRNLARYSSQFNFLFPHINKIGSQFSAKKLRIDGIVTDSWTYKNRDSKIHVLSFWKSSFETIHFHSLTLTISLHDDLEKNCKVS